MMEISNLLFFITFLLHTANRVLASGGRGRVLQPCQRKVQTLAIVRLRRSAVAELFVQLCARQMRLIGGFNRNAGIKIIARLAPQFFARAQAAEREQ